MAGAACCAAVAASVMAMNAAARAHHAATVNSLSGSPFRANLTHNEYQVLAAGHCPTCHENVAESLRLTHHHDEWD